MLRSKTEAGRLPLYFVFLMIALSGGLGGKLIFRQFGSRAPRGEGGETAAVAPGRLTTSKALRPVSVDVETSLPAPTQIVREELIVSLIMEAETAPGRTEHEEAMRDLDTVLLNADVGRVVRDLPYVAFNTLAGTRLVERWAMQDRAAAAEWLAGCPGADMAQANVLLRGWLEHDAAGVRRYVEHLASGYWKQEVLKAAVWEGVECGNFEEAIRYAQQLGTNDDREGLLVAALKQNAPDAASRRL